MADLTIEEARAILLGAQGLLQTPPPRAGPGDVMSAIRRMAVLQIDSISVVARSPYLVLWSRIGDFEPHRLDDHLEAGDLFESWAHAACFIPSEEYGLFRRGMLDSHPRARAWLADHPDLAAQVLSELRQRGELRSSDYERTDGQRSGWWQWKPEKTALECLLSTGEVMIARRDRNFQRVYVLRERVMPGWDDAATPSAEEARRALTLKAVRALGVVKARWVPDYFKMPVRGIALLMEELASEGLVRRVSVEGWEVPGYLHPDNEALLERVAAGTEVPARTVPLSPFDPVVWDRARAEELFGFTYRIETYTPAAKRRYGYFTLPILHRGALVGRLDPKAYRKEGFLGIHAVHLEPGVIASEDLVAGLRATLADLAAWHGLERVEVRASDPPELVAALRG